MDNRLVRLLDFCSGMSTGDNPKVPTFYGHEVSLSKISFDCKGNDQTALKRWYPCNSGGNFMKWYGNNEIVVDWQKQWCQDQEPQRFCDSKFRNVFQERSYLLKNKFRALRRTLQGRRVCL
jgi:type II restriction/modification system DNA methylase subunit YeeA